MVSLLENCAFADKLTILEQDAGLHFLLKVDTELTDSELTQKLLASGIRIRPLSHYYHQSPIRSEHTFVVNYASLNEEDLQSWLTRLPDFI